MKDTQIAYLFFMVFAFVSIPFTIRDGLYLNEAREETIEAVNNKTLTFEKSKFRLSVEEVREEIKPNYNYNLSNVGKYLSVEEINKTGGVCSNYAYWWYTSALDKGYLGSTVKIYGKPNYKIAHELAILYTGDLSEYCVVDGQTIVGCVKLK